MSEEYSAEHDEYNEDTEFESHLGDSDAEYEDEEISTDEVDRVLESLTNLLEGVESATVHEHLEEAYNQIFSLVYEEESAGETELEEADEVFAGEFEEAIEEDSVNEEYDEDFESDDLLDEEAA